MRDRVVFDKPPDWRGNVAMMGPAGCPTGFVGQNKRLQEAQMKLARWHVEENARMLTRMGEASIYGHRPRGPGGEALLRNTTSNATAPPGGKNKWAASGSTGLGGTTAADEEQKMVSTAPPAIYASADATLPPRLATPRSDRSGRSGSGGAGAGADGTLQKQESGSSSGQGSRRITKSEEGLVTQAQHSNRSPNTGGARGGGELGSSAISLGKSPIARQLSKREHAGQDPGGLASHEDDLENPTLGVDLLIDGLRNRMRVKGLETMFMISEFFKKVDNDGSGHLSLQEFTDGLRAAGVLKSAAEAKLIFAHFDEDNSGSISWKEFLRCVRGVLPEARRKVVHEAFRHLDSTGDGVLTVEDLMKHYRSFSHPDVLAGVRDEKDIYEEMLRSFDTINQDGKISLAEFELYYEDISGLIDRDEFFEGMLRNCWHLEGAHGGHCTRLHVTMGVASRRDDKASLQARGSFGRAFNSGIGHTIQETVELRPDIGLNKQDPDFFNECRRRLEAMGYTDIDKIEVLGRY